MLHMQQILSSYCRPHFKRAASPRNESRDASLGNVALLKLGMSLEMKWASFPECFFCKYNGQFQLGHW